MNTFYQQDDKTALEAISEAQRIAFAPFTFQATVALNDLGILAAIDEGAEVGCSAAEIGDKLGLSEYGVKVLLDAGLSIGLVWQKEGRYCLCKTGYFILHDKMTQVNLNFSRDFCYQGLEGLKRSVETGKPEGLKLFANGDTLYPHLSSLPESAKSSWFNFDHYYSDNAFDEVLPVVLSHKPKLLLDIGGNTGKWAIRCASYDPDVHVMVLDLPPQLAVMQEQVEKEGFDKRIDGMAADLLNPDQSLPNDADAIWMSQFLDCFSEQQISTILSNVARAIKPGSKFYILETCWNRQVFEAAAFSLNCTSLYFTCFANGNSRMYHSDTIQRLVEKAGLKIIEEIDHIGIGHTLFICE